jgi:hypothetical protein
MPSTATPIVATPQNTPNLAQKILWMTSDTKLEKKADRRDA